MIKTAYKRLALKYHPDRNRGKEEWAKEKFQKISEAYEILKGDNSTSDIDDFIRRFQRRNKDTELKILKIETEILDRSLTFKEIQAVFNTTSPKVSFDDLDPNLWHPYKDYVQKIWDMPITTIPDGKSRSEELKQFKAEMIKAIKEAETALKIRKENKERERRRKEREEQIKDYFKNYHREEKKKKDRIIARLNATQSINDEVLFYDEDWEDVDNNLWSPYETWEEKIENIEIKSSGEESIDTSELNKFKWQIIDLIKSRGRKRREEKEKQEDKERDRETKERAKFLINEEKRYSIKSIEELMAEKGIKPEELGKYSDYKEQVNNLDKIWEIQALADDVINYMWDEIIMKRNYAPKTPNNFNYAWKNLQEELREEDKKELEEEIEELKNQKSETQTPEKQTETQKKLSEKEEELKKIKEGNKEENNWVQEKEKLEKELQKLRDQGNQEKLTKRIKELEGVVQQLKIENEQLKIQVQKLKEENDNTPEYKSYLVKKEQELQAKQSKLQQLESIITHNNNNPWPIKPIIIGGISILALLGLMVYRIRRNRVRR